MRQKAAGKLSKQYLRVFFSVVVLVDLLITLLLCVWLQRDTDLFHGPVHGKASWSRPVPPRIFYMNP